MGEFNRILDDSARAKYAFAIDKLWQITPEMMHRKPARANVQQGFSLAAIDYCMSELNVGKSPEEVKNLKLLCIGSYEDTCCDALKKMGYNITEVEPRFNYDLNGFCALDTTKQNSFDIVFSISVLEHVENDVEFMTKAAELIKPGGYGVFTVDYNDNGIKPPEGDFNVYTQKQLKETILPVLKDCELLDIPEWDCPNPDFKWGDFIYTFASLVFKKK